MDGNPITQIDNAFWAALSSVLQQFTLWLNDQADGGAILVMQKLIELIRNVGFITTTDTKLVNTLSDLFGWNEVRPLVDSVLKFALVVGAIAHMGHNYWGWRAMPDSLQRWAMTAALTRVSAELLDWTLQVMSDLTAGIAASIPDFPNITGLNPGVLIVMMMFWSVLLFQLVMACAERVAWLVMLKPIAGLALLTWVLPQSQWVASLYIKTWVGWLVGQFFVVLGVAAMEQLINAGGIPGYFLSCACLVVARKSISILVPGGGEGLLGVKLGPLKV